MTASKIVAAAASGAGGGAGLDVDEVFSTFLYDGTGSAQTITNNIDLSSEGGLVWAKSRSSRNHILSDTARGTGKVLFSNSNSAEDADATTITSYNSNGFTMGSSSLKMNTSGEDFVSWTFRNSPMFQCLTYTGNGVAGRSISHNLGGTVGTLIIKRTDNTGSWIVWHRSTSSSYLFLDGTDAATSGTISNVSSTAFTIESVINTSYNASGGTYVAYLFAHHANDGSATGFGSGGDSPVISCGSVTTNGSGVASVNLGFETQWLMYKKSSGSGSWVMYDNMRGLATTGSNIGAILYADGNYATLSTSAGDAKATATGIDFSTGENNTTYIYMAIRRGSLAAPDDATKVFHIDESDSSSAPKYRSPFPVDFAIKRDASTSDSNLTGTRLLQGKYLITNSTDAEASAAQWQFDFMNGWRDQSSSAASDYSWMWKRAPSYFDVVGYVGAGAAQTVNHNLSVVPEMMWIKNRDSAENWAVYHSALGTSKYLHLNTTDAGLTTDAANRWNNTSPTATQFTVGTSTEVSHFTRDFIAYLFATVAGVSKVGSYTGTGSDQTIDCGFTNGARFVLAKRSSTSGIWGVFDTARGIVAGNDPLLRLNATNAESSSDFIDPHSSGFTWPSEGGGFNTSGITYIFYAIA